MPEDDMTDQSSLPRYLDVLDGVIILAAINDRGEYLPLPAESIERKLTGELREYMRDDKVKHVVISDRQDIELVKALIPKHVPVTRARMFCDVILGLHLQDKRKVGKISRGATNAESMATSELSKTIEKINHFINNKYIPVIESAVTFEPQNDLRELIEYIDELRSKSLLINEDQEKMMEEMIGELEDDINHSINALREAVRCNKEGRKDELQKWTQVFYERFHVLKENYKKNARRFLKSLAEGL